MIVPQNFVQLVQPFLPFHSGEEINEHTRLREYGLDSMREIELLFAVEDKYCVLLSDVLLTRETFETAGSLWRAISEAMRSQGESS